MDMYSVKFWLIEETTMGVTTFVMTTGLVATGVLNFLLAASTPDNAINWLAGIISVSYGALLIAMWKHMTNDDKHITKNVDTSKFITGEQCVRTHNSVVAKLEEVKNDLIARDEEVEKKYLADLKYTKLMMKMMLLKAGVDPKDLTDSELDNGK